MTGEKMNLLEKIIAHVKGDLLGRVLSEKEYYYLKFGCETSEDITIIKSTTAYEAKIFLDCCWYFGVERPSHVQLEFIKTYRKFSNASSDLVSPYLCTGESYDPEDEHCQSCPARVRCPVEKVDDERDKILTSAIGGFTLIVTMCQAKYRHDEILDASTNAIEVLEALRSPHD